MAGETAPVSVAEDVAILMAEHLHEQGRLGPIGPNTAQLMSHKLGQAVAHSWGVRATRFEDDGGGGWICDVSSAYEGEMMYAVVRSEAGARIVTECVEEDVAIALSGGAKRPDAPTTVTAPQGGQGAAPVPAAVARELPGALALVGYLRGSGGGVNDTEETWEANTPQFIRTTVAEVPGIVQGLLADGHPPHLIEVWGARKQPKVNISLE